MKTVKGICLKGVVAVLAVGFLFMVWSPVYAADEKPVHLSMATFKSGSGWFIMAQAMAKIMENALPKGSTVDVLPYSGGVGNPLLLQKGKADIALGFPVESRLALKGQSPYKKPVKDLRLLAAGFDTYWYVFSVRQDTGITSIGEIKKKKYPLRLVILPKGSSGEWDTSKVMEAYGINIYKDLKAWGGKVTNTSFPSALDMVKDGQANAFAHVSTPGHPSWTQLATMVKIRFLPIDERIRNEFIKKYGFSKGTIPKGTFRGVEKDIPVLGFSTNLITSAKLPEDVAYKITKAIATHKKDLVTTYKAARVFNPKKAWDSTVPLHPGAKKYYQEMGYMK
ncbi:MAG: TAXI family TRAP transporter solute-binding subunit [Desulfobacteraceae bacterium]|nr:TAXI family TRAP transporter solute-binding subunit [Desulfobacteraceae bacterium]